MICEKLDKILINNAPLTSGMQLLINCEVFLTIYKVP